MREYLLYHEGKQWHFFIKPFYGLCYRKRESGRFTNFEVLLPEACEDFSAISHGDEISVVCQDNSGSILTLVFRENKWQKSCLLESKAAVPYPKYFTQIPRGNYMNLFYVIAHKEKQMLVHQILNTEGCTPTVVDRISPGTPPFLALSGTGTDIMVLYQNESGVCGSRTYRWSKKEFTRFMPVNPSAASIVRQMKKEPEERIRYAALKPFDKLQNLVYFEKTPVGDFTEPVTVYLDCPEDATPIFCAEGEKLYLIWKEQGGIMSSFSTDDGQKWSKPIRYVKNAAISPVEYVLCQDGNCHHAYGYEKDYDIMFYVSPSFGEEPKKSGRSRFHQVGYEAELFAKSLGYRQEESGEPGPDPVISQLQETLRSLKNQFFNLRLELAAIQRQLGLTEEQSAAVPLTEHEEDIDAVLLKQFSQGLTGESAKNG